MKIDNVMSFLRIVFIRNGYWKLLSFIIAVVVYFSIRSEISHIRVITVPVETDYEAVTGGAAIESVEPRSVQVTLRGSYSEVNQLLPATVRCVVRPKQKKSVVQDVVAMKIGHTNLRGVRGFRVAKIEPNAVVVKFDVPMTLRLAVAPPVVLGKARGRVQLVYDQTNAVVKGSRRLLSPIDAAAVQIQTDTIDVDGRSQTFSTQVKLLPPGDAVNAVVDPSEMMVHVMIISEKATAKIERVPIVVTQPYAASNRWKLEPEWVDIEITGRSEVVKAVTLNEIVATVNSNIPLTTGGITSEVPVSVHIQQGVTVDEVKPSPPVVKLISLLPLPPRTAEGPAEK